MFFLIASLLGAATTVLYAVRTGDIFDRTDYWERLARAGVGFTLLALTFGLLERLRLGSPVLWPHYLIVLALAASTVGFSGVVWKTRRDRRP